MKNKDNKQIKMKKIKNKKQSSKNYLCVCVCVCVCVFICKMIVEITKKHGENVVLKQ